MRSVAPRDDYVDKPTGRTIAKMTTGQIYWGAVPFVLIQIVMVGLIIVFPNLVSGGLTKAKAFDTSKQHIEFQPMDEKKEMDASKLFAPAEPASAPPAAPASSDPLEDAARGVKK